MLMARQVLVTAVVSSAISVSAMFLAMPRLVDAQLSVYRAEAYLLAGPGGSRGSLTAEASGSRLNLWDGRNNFIQLFVAGGEKLIFTDANGHDVVLLGTNTDTGSGAFLLNDPNSQATIVLAIANGKPSMFMLGSDGNVLWSAP